MRFDHIIGIALLSYILDNSVIYLNYSYTSLILFINILGLYLFISNIQFEATIRYNMNNEW